MNYRLSQEAKQDLAEIKAYLVEQEGKALARYVLSRLTEGFRFIANVPGAGHSRPDLTDETVKFWSVFSYLIVYDSISQPVMIARVLHSARNIEAILRRDVPNI